MSDETKTEEELCSDLLGMPLADVAARVRRIERAPPREIAGLLGFDSGETPIPARSYGTIVTSPQVIFKPTHLWVPKDCSCFDLTDIKVGRNSQLLSSDDVPAEFFSRLAEHEHLATTVEVLERAAREGHIYDLDTESAASIASLVGIPLTIETCQVAMPISLHVRNLSDSPWRFRAVLYGRGVE